jgi:hypothetical protein
MGQAVQRVQGGQVDAARHGSNPERCRPGRQPDRSDPEELLVRFTDDIVVRIAQTAEGTRVDVRSKSRVGRSDLGQNAKLIRIFLAKLNCAWLIPCGANARGPPVCHALMWFCPRRGCKVPAALATNKGTTVTRIARRLAVRMFILVFGSAAPMPGEGNEQTPEGAPDSFKRLTDPTDFHTRFDVRNEYQSLQAGGSRNVLVPRFEYALSPAFLLRADVPYVWVDPDRPGTSQESGLGDISVRAQARLLRTPAYAVVAAAELALDTAQDPALGTGRYVFQPLAYVAVGLPRYKSTIFPYVQHFWAFGGSTDVEINTTLLRSGVLSIFPKKTYTYVEPSLYIDWERDARTGGTLEVEVGRFVSKGLGLYLRPGVGLWGDIPPVYDWNFEVGLHYFF